MGNKLFLFESEGQLYSLKDSIRCRGAAWNKAIDVQCLVNAPDDVETVSPGTSINSTGPYGYDGFTTGNGLLELFYFF